MKSSVFYLKKDVLAGKKVRKKKLSLKKQAKLIQLLANLFSNGFSLKEIIEFLSVSNLVEEEFSKIMDDSLKEGKNLSEILDKLGFSSMVVTQVNLADYHGNLEQSLVTIEGNIRKLLHIKRRLIQVATYPMILLFFLLGAMLALNQFLLPQAEGDSIAIWIVKKLPMIFLIFSLLILVFSISFMVYFKRKPAIASLSFLARFPLLSKYVNLYLTALFAREIGSLLEQGLELRDTLEILKRQKYRIFKEVAKETLSDMEAGIEFTDKVSNYTFFKKELALIIHYGEFKAKLGRELEIYSDECWEDFFFKVEKSLQLIQPLIFIFVALMIVLIYAAMLLPIYQNMEGFI